MNVAGSTITPRSAAELVSHEAIVLEAYKDSVGIWTALIGVTDASGHKVGRYKDNPTTVEHALAIFLWLVREKYLPPVLKAFAGRTLTEAQLAAALSFHYNTGAIGKASWVKSFMAGQKDQARAQFLQWNKPAAIIERRKKEADLFFDGKWSNDGTALIIPVSKPSYQPSFRRAQRVNIMADLAKAMATGDGAA